MTGPHGPNPAPELTRVGVAGFSFGGYTGALVGARVDPSLVAAIFGGAVPLPPIDEMPDALERLRASSTAEASAASAAEGA